MPERGGLVQRMDEARLRTVEARAQRASQAMPLDAVPATPAAPSVAACPPLARREIRPTRGAALPHWRLADTPGEHLVLLPGHVYFGAQAASVRTLLGSCVAVTLWHPRHRVGGMCHFLLPSRGARPADGPDGRYGDEALETLANCVRSVGCDPRDFEAHLYGGADTLPDGVGKKFNIGERNIEQAWRLIDQHGYPLCGVDVGEDIPRTVMLTLATGEVQMRRCEGQASHVDLSASAARSGRGGRP